MKSSGQSHIPVERLARLLLQRAREDDFLLRRQAANDDEPLGPNHRLVSPRVESPQVAHPSVAPPRLKQPGMARAGLVAPDLLRPRAAHQTGRSAGTAQRVGPRLAALEELVSVALLSAHEAEDASRDTRRQARRGIALALAVGTAALALALGGTIVPCLDHAGQRVAAVIEAVPQRAVETADHRTADTAAAADVNNPTNAPADAAGSAAEAGPAASGTA